MYLSSADPARREDLRSVLLHVDALGLHLLADDLQQPLVLLSAVQCGGLGDGEGCWLPAAGLQHGVLDTPVLQVGLQHTVTVLAVAVAGLA